MSKPNCFKCKHYFVSWDPKMPRGCRLYDIKSSFWPSQIVKEASGAECPDWEEKKGPPKEADPFDFNNPRFWDEKKK